MTRGGSENLFKPRCTGFQSGVMETRRLMKSKGFGNGLRPKPDPTGSAHRPRKGFENPITAVKPVNNRFQPAPELDLCSTAQDFQSPHPIFRLFKRRIFLRPAGRAYKPNGVDKSGPTLASPRPVKTSGRYSPVNACHRFPTIRVTLVPISVYQVQ